MNYITAMIQRRRLEEDPAAVGRIALPTLDRESDGSYSIEAHTRGKGWRRAFTVADVDGWIAEGDYHPRALSWAEREANGELALVQGEME